MRLSGRIAVVSVAVMGLCIPSAAQIRMLPREKVDSIVAAASRPQAFSDDFLQFDSLVVDAGTVREDDGPIVAEFRFRNTRGESILVKDIRTSCTCVKAELIGPSLLPPDSTAVIKVIYDQRRHTGRHDRMVSIFLPEDKEKPAAQLVLKSLVLPED